MRFRISALLTVAVFALAVALGGIAALGGAAAGVAGVAGHAVTGDASTAPRASAVMQDEANAPGFRLRVKHRRAVVRAGGTAVYVVRLRRTYGFEYAVTLRALGLPPGAHARFTPRAPRPGGSASLAISTDVTSPTGTHIFRVLAASHGVSAIAATTITIR